MYLLKILSNRAAFAVLLSLLLAVPASSNSPLHNSLKKVCGQLEIAIDNRKFADAKELINELLPLLKRDIKEAKKILSAFNKSGSDEAVEFQNNYNRRSELYKSAKALIESSPAAIRVKGKDLIVMLNEYLDLADQSKNEI